jgi:hypothetical protein
MVQPEAQSKMAVMHLLYNFIECIVLKSIILSQNLSSSKKAEMSVDYCQFIVFLLERPVVVQAIYVDRKKWR